MAMQMDLVGTVSIRDPATGEVISSVSVNPSIATVTKWTGKQRLVIAAGTALFALDQSNITTVSALWIRASRDVALEINDATAAQDIESTREAIVFGQIDKAEVTVPASGADTVIEYMMAGT